MATHTAIRSQHFTTTGSGTEDTVTLNAGWRFVEVLNRSSTAGEAINFSVDGTATNATPPDDTDIVLPSSSLVKRAPSESGQCVVKLRALSGTPAVSVTGLS